MKGFPKIYATEMLMMAVSLIFVGYLIYHSILLEGVEMDLTKIYGLMVSTWGIQAIIMWMLLCLMSRIRPIERIMEKDGEVHDE